MYGALNDPLLLSISVADPSSWTTLDGHASTVNWVGFSPDGRFDRTIGVWNSITGAQVKSFRGHRDWVWSAVFTADGQQILSGGGGASNDDPGTDWALRLWDFE